jgi:hypothetical protein
MAIGLRSTATFVPNDPLSSTNTATCNAPAGIQNLDVLVAVVARSPTASATTALTSTGWTVNNFFTSTANQGPSAMLWKVAGGSEPSTYTFTSVSYTGSDAWDVMLMAFSGVDTVTPIAANAAVTNAGSASSSVVAPTVTPTDDGLLVCAHLAVKFNATANTYGWTPPAGMAEIIDLGANFIVGAVSTVDSFAGVASGTKTATFITRSGGAATTPQNPAQGMTFALDAASSYIAPFVSQYGSFH